MRKILLPFAMMGSMALPMAACDVEEGDADATTAPPDATNETGAETELPPPDDEFYAVIVTDQEIFPTHRIYQGVQCTSPTATGCNPCATSSSRAHGADIDAIGLFDGDEVLGYLDNVDYQDGDLCTGDESNLMTDTDKVKGAPDASISDGFVSLGGGWLTGEFDDALQITNGLQIVVFEVGTKCGSNNNCGGVDEGYEVFVAPDLDCAAGAGQEYPWSNCAEQLGGEAEGEFTIPVSGI